MKRHELSSAMMSVAAGGLLDPKESNGAYVTERLDIDVEEFIAVVRISLESATATEADHSAVAASMALLWLEVGMKIGADRERAKP